MKAKTKKKKVKKGRPRGVPDMEYPTEFAAELFKKLQSGKVEVANFGVFTIVHVPQKKLYHNFSGRTRIVKAYSKLKFTQSPALKDELTLRF